MKIVDRYVLRQFTQTFVICLVSLTGIYVVFHAFTNLDNFLRYAQKQGSLLGVLSQYYGCQSVLFFDRTLGLLALTSAMFTVTWLQRHHELTALMAAGISKARAVAPIVGGVGVIVLAGVANRELVIPQLPNELALKPKELSGNAPREVVPQYDERTNVHLRGRAAYADRQRIEKPVFRLPPALDSSARQIAGREAFYQPPQDGRPGGYLVDGVEQPKDLHLQSSLFVGDRPLVITARDAPDWLRPDQCFLVSDVTFEQLTNNDTWRELLSTAQLIRSLRNRSPDFGGKIRVAIHARLIQPLLDMTLLFLGLPLVLAWGTRNVFFAMFLCGALMSAFMAVVMGFQQLGSMSVIPPALAAWAPLMIFAPLAVEMAQSLKK